MRRVLAVLAVVTLFGAGCGDDDTETISATTTTDGEETGPQTYPVRVDARSTEIPTAWISFFPAKLNAHPGDTVEFTSEFVGEAHTVAGGTLVEAAVAAEKKADPEAEGPPPPEVLKLPQTFNDEAAPGQDPLLQAGLQPCYSATEEPPTKDACPKDKQEQPDEFTGKEAIYSSGYLADEETFKVKLADDIAPGTYTFICLLHGSHMSEEVTVVDAATKVQSPDEVRKAGEALLESFMEKAREPAEKVRSTTSKDAPAGAFIEDEETPSAGVNVFPTEISVKAGETVTWTVNGFHSISLNAPEDARPWITRADDGTVRLNQKTFLPSNSPPLPPAPAPAEGAEEEGPPPQVKVDGGKFDGKSFVNSGIPLDDAAVVYSLTFPTAGTYKYICLVHPDMEGTVKVA